MAVRSRRGGRYPAAAHTVAVFASLRLREAAWPGDGAVQLATRLRALRSNRYGESVTKRFAPAPRPSRFAATEIAAAGYRPPRRESGGIPPVACHSVRQIRVRVGHDAQSDDAPAMSGFALGAKRFNSSHLACLNEAASGRAVSCEMRAQNRSSQVCRRSRTHRRAAWPTRTRICPRGRGMGKELPTRTSPRSAARTWFAPACA